MDGSRVNAPIAGKDMLALADHLRPALLRVSRRLRHEAQRAGASALDAQVLGAVKKNPGIGVSALAEREQMTKPSMSSHVKRLEAAGLLAREAVSGDDRRVGLSLTVKGARALEAVRRRRNDWLAARLSTLSADDQAVLAAAAGPLLALAGDR
jgi:DNA-binding MarR family transcriptional regulator